MAKYDHFSQRKVTKVGTFVNNRFRKIFWKLVQKNTAEKKMSVCEIGPGTGELAKIIRTDEHSYVAFDNADSIVDLLKKQSLNVIHQSVPPIGADDNQFDIVIASHVIEHSKGPDAAMLFCQEAHRVLKPGGFFLIAVPNIYEITRFGPLFYDFDWTHAYPTTPVRVDNLMKDSNFVKKESCHIYMGFVGYLGRVLRQPFKFILNCLGGILPDGIRYSEKFLKAKNLLTDNYCALYQKPTIN